MKSTAYLFALLMTGCTAASRHSDDMMRAEYAAFKAASDAEVKRFKQQEAEIRDMIRNDLTLRH